MWTFLWFVCFCLLAAQWTRTKDTRGIPKDAAHATIAFSFFSMATWVSGAAVVLFHNNGTEVLRYVPLSSIWTVIIIVGQSKFTTVQIIDDN